MAKVNGLKRLNKLLQKSLPTKKANNKALMKEIGEFVVERIRSFTRSGKSIAGDKPKALKGLSESYKDMRRGAVQFRTINGQVVPLVGPDPALKKVDRKFFDPDLSNLTFSGQLLKALTVKTEKTSVNVFVKNNRRSRLTSNEKSLTNAKVAEIVAENGRPFMGLDDNGIERVNKIIVNEIRRRVKRFGTAT